MKNIKTKTVHVEIDCPLKCINRVRSRMLNAAHLEVSKFFDEKYSANCDGNPCRGCSHEFVDSYLCGICSRIGYDSNDRYEPRPDQEAQDGDE